LHSRLALAHRAALSCPGPSSLACGAVQAWASPACLPQPNERSTATAPQQQQHHPPPLPGRPLSSAPRPLLVPRSPLPVRTPLGSLLMYFAASHTRCACSIPGADLPLFPAFSTSHLGHRDFSRLHPKKPPTCDHVIQKRVPVPLRLPGRGDKGIGVGIQDTQLPHVSAANLAVRPHDNYEDRSLPAPAGADGRVTPGQHFGTNIGAPLASAKADAAADSDDPPPCPQCRLVAPDGHPGTTQSLRSLPTTGRNQYDMRLHRRRFRPPSDVQRRVALRGGRGPERGGLLPKWGGIMYGRRLHRVRRQQQRPSNGGQPVCVYLRG